MKVLKLFFFFFLYTTALFAQQQTIRTSIYFDTDSSSITPEHKKKLDRISDTIKKLNVGTILLQGHTDNDADSAYNMTLSLKRVIAIKNYFAQKKIDSTLIKFSYHGENKPLVDNETDNGKQKNRRVDIIFTVNPIPESEDKTTIIKPEPDSCIADTTFVLSQGTIVTMNLCEFLQQQDCGGIRLSEFINPQMLRDSAISTMDINNNVLISGGMVGFKTCNNLCLKKPIIFLIKVKEDCEPPCTMSLWEETTAWKPFKNASVKTIFNNGKKYLEFKLTCPGLFNLDCGYNLQSLTIKIPRKYRVIEAKISNDCPMWSYKTKIDEETRSNIAKICIICQSTNELKNNYVYVKAVSPKGDTVIVNHKKIETLTLRYKLFPGHSCRGPKQKKPCPNIFYYLGRRKSKIKIREEDFDIIIPGKNKTKTP